MGFCWQIWSRLVRWQQPHSLALPELGILTQPVSIDEGEKGNSSRYEKQISIFRKTRSRHVHKHQIWADQTPETCGYDCHMLHDLPRCMPVLSSSCVQGQRILQVWTCTGTLPGCTPGVSVSPGRTSSSAGPKRKNRLWAAR